MALTPEELRQRIPNWSLESDGQLLQYMISIAQNLEEKCTKTRDNLNSLLLQVNQTELNLANATNQFTAVEQVKFVENRVEEDDESFYGLRRRRQQQRGEERKEQTNPDQNAERSLEDLIQLALERSIEGMYTSYEKVTLELTDSDTSDGEDTSDGTRFTDTEQSGAKASIMRAIPRHPFIDRPLPHVIGSKEWQNKWHVGLIDSDDESSSERKEEYSESSSETDDDGGMFPSQPNSKNHTPSESESSIWGAEVGRKRAPSMDPSITGDDGSSVYSYASSSKHRTLPTHPVRPVAPIGTSLKPPSLFPEEPPEIVDDVKRRSEKGLFDESQEEDDEEKPSLPLPLPTPRQIVSRSDTVAPFFKGNANQPARKTVNLFDDEPPPPQDELGRVPQPKKSINLFIESEDEEETRQNARNNNTQQVVTQERTERMEHVGSKSTVTPSGPPATNPRTMTKLVDELNNNFRKQQPAARPEKAGRIIPDQSTQFANQRPVVSNLFDDEPPIDDFDRLFAASNASATRNQPTALLQPAFKTVVERKTVNLFADDDDDDQDTFDGIVVGSNEKQPEPVRSPFISPNRILLPKQPERSVTGKKKSIFDESESEVESDDGGLFANSGRDRTVAPKPVVASVAASEKPPQKTMKSIFSDSSEAEDDDDALFGRSSDIVKNKLDALKRNGVGNAAQAVTNPLPKPSDQVLVKNDRTIEKAIGKAADTYKSLFDEGSDDDHTSTDAEGSLFSRGPSEKPTATEKAVVVPRKNQQSLFGDVKPIGPFGMKNNAQKGEKNGNKSDVTARDLESSARVREHRTSTDGDLFGNVQTNPLTKVSNPTDVRAADVVESKLKDQPTVGRTSIESIAVPRSVVVRDPLSIDNEQPVTEGAVKSVVDEPNAPAAGSIRTMIMKKSIFNSDSESEADDSIFGASSGTESTATLGAGVDKNKKSDTEIAQSENPSELFGNYPVVDELQINVLEKEPASKKKEEKVPEKGKHLPAASCTDGNEQTTANRITHDPIDNTGEASEKSTPPLDIAEETSQKVSSAVKTSIFDESSSENEAEDDLNTFVTGIKSSIGSFEQETEKQPDHLEDVPPNVQASEEKQEKTDQTTLAEISQQDNISECSPPGLKVVEAAESSQLLDPSCIEPTTYDVTIPDDHEFEQSTTQEEQTTAGMIANDIDYFLRTNETVSSDIPSGGDVLHLEEGPRLITPPPVKSEPKSALNFSPIGLFDDVPPPDDESDGDVESRHEQQKHFPSVDTGASLPPVDDASEYPTQSQSLNFIPNGSGAANGRTRYLFDDEPPPDEADNAQPGLGESPSFKGMVSKALFDDRQKTLDGPVSLPSMVQETAKAQPRPKVNKLNAKIAINVAALLPGARRPSPVAVAAIKTNDSMPTDGDFVAKQPSDSRPSPAVPTNESTGETKLAGLNKGRARIPAKRKPPSRHTLRAASQAHQNDDHSGGPDGRIVVGSEKMMPHIEANVGDAALPKPNRDPDLPYPKGEQLGWRNNKEKMDPLVDRLSASVRSTSARTVRPDGNETVSSVVEKLVPKKPLQSKSKSIFGDSDSNDDGDGDDFFSKLPTLVPPRASAVTQRAQQATGAEKNTRSIFGSDEDDDGDDAEAVDDIFGVKKSTIARQLKAKATDAGHRTTLGVVVKGSVKPPPSKGTTSLFGDDDNDDDDDDDLFSSKTKTFPNATPVNRPMTTPVTTKATTTSKTTTTRAVKDPLADLLNS